MKIIALLPVRNEAWVLPHALAALSAFCDVVLVSDQNSDDESLQICRRFPKVSLLESRDARVCEQARWQLLDAARDYDGFNLLWCIDADEVVSPSLAGSLFERRRNDLTPGAAIECLFYHLWGAADRYRDDASPYRPHTKVMAIVDDRQWNYDRSSALPLHQPRVPVRDDMRVMNAHELPVFHLQYLVVNRNQMKQAWYRCKEWLHGDRSAAAINWQYSITLLPRRVRTSQAPPAWLEGTSLPDLAIDREPSWQEREVLAWFDEHGAAFFEPLEIWHIPLLAAEFRRRVGREPRPDRSYRPSISTRARQLGARALRAARRRMAS